MRLRDAAVTTPIKTLADIAALAGVTPATVSRALSGHTRISHVTRGRVLDIAERHGFQINQTARNLRLGRTDAIGVVIPLGHESAQRVSDPFYTMLIGQLLDGLAQRGKAMLLSAVTPHDSAWLANLSRSGRVDGIVVLCQSDQDPVLRDVARTYRPLVVWGEDGGNYCCVGTDNREGGRLATEHLLAPRPATYRLCRHDRHSRARRTPCRLPRRAGPRGRSRPARVPVPLAFDPNSPLLDRLFAGQTEIDGVVAASDVIAIHVIRALRQHGRRVPDDVAVIGYDDVSLAAHTSPSLTTVRQDFALAATTLLDLLFRRIGGEDAASERIPA